MRTNSELSELLAQAAAEYEPRSTKARALRRAARKALVWTVEVSDVVAAGAELTALPSVGPWLAEVIAPMLDGPSAATIDPLRTGFLTRTEVDAALARNGAELAVHCDLQMHTDWTDGHSTLDAMARASALRGYSHVAITDHSRDLAIAHGMDETRLAAQGVAIAEINDQLAAEGARMSVLHGIEMNLSPLGEGDMDPRALGELDIVLGAFHSKLRWADDQTDRYLAGIENPDIHVLAHPRCRMFNFRAGLRCDWAAVFGRAAELDKAVEIDGYPDRQDLDVGLLELARAAGCRISLGSDAHHAVDLGFIEYAVAAALIARIPADRVVNCMSRADLLAWTRPER